MGDENGCAKGCSFTYGSEAAAHGRLSTDSGFTMGGYCKSITANRHFTCKVRYDSRNLYRDRLKGGPRPLRPKGDRSRRRDSRNLAPTL